MFQRQTLAFVLSSSFALLAQSCSSGGGGTTGFQVSDLSVQDGAVWEINREIVLKFTEPVDFTTVSSNTINIRSAADVPATGVFRLRDPQTVVFQPNCPTLDDYSDAGLQPGGVRYVLRVVGRNTSSNTVRSLTGAPLGVQQMRTFSTPASMQPSIAFQDVRLGPPVPILREQGSADANASHLEIGGDPEQRVYFELDPNREVVLSQPGFELPLNLYSDLASRVGVLIAFDQPVDPSRVNVSESRLRLEYLARGAWRPIDTRVTLVANCTERGATVRLDPIGVLPSSSSFRAVVLAGFQDLVGEALLQTRDDFALAPTRATEFTSLTPPDVLSDEFDESFQFGGAGPLSFEDTTAVFDTPQAAWGEGRLSAAFAFDGTGGPGETFDWIIHSGENFIFDTTHTPIIGGPDGIPTAIQNAVDGRVDVRNLILEPGATLNVQGPNPLRIQATGEVRILGQLDLSGLPAKDVITLNTGNQAEVGGSGMAGGGRGGSASENITGPTPRGGRGQGPFRQANLGGQGGEMGFSSDASKNARRPGGGGGGRFTKDWVGTTTFVSLSLAAGPGSDGHPLSTGAETGDQPSRGGAPGSGPFLDASDDNDFFGVAPVVLDGELVGHLRGELPRLWAGYGGGGGGNAGQRFPNPSWTLSSDEKGGGGGGGAGGLHVKALGRIVFGAEGEIVANGGRGATGENTLFLDHVGGTGGGGSGGHIVLESATQVDFTDRGRANGALRDVLLACGPPERAGPLDDVDTCRQSSLCCPDGCKVYSNGGAGGAGLIQIHVPEPTRAPSDELDARIVVPTAALGAADVLDQVSSPPALAMVPTFGKRSKVRSRWIPIGGADEKPDGSEGRVRFLFDGTDDDGKIETSDGVVTDRRALWSEPDLGASASAVILPGGLTLELRGAALAAIRAGETGDVSNDVYLRTPALLEDCVVRLRLEAAHASFEDFPIAHAAYDEGEAAAGDEVLRVTVGDDRPLTAFNPDDAAGRTGLLLLPRFFHVVTGGLGGALPDTAFVRVLFQATDDVGNGQPDEIDPLTPWTADITQFDALPAGALQFFRFEVEFDLDAGDRGISAHTEPVTLDFLKIPFVF